MPDHVQCRIILANGANAKTVLGALQQADWNIVRKVGHSWIVKHNTGHVIVSKLITLGRHHRFRVDHSYRPVCSYTTRYRMISMRCSSHVTFLALC